ncbi:MAG: hypothetical protein AVDCRST_MAG61-547, partial [uncultured Friedmanniella sp.]
ERGRHRDRRRGPTRAGAAHRSRPLARRGGGTGAGAG